MRTGIGRASRQSLGFGCVFADMDLDGRLNLVVANGHIDEPLREMRGTVGYAQAPQLFLNRGGRFEDVAAEAGAAFVTPKVGRGLACGDFDRDGDVDLLLTANNGPAQLFRADHPAGRRSVRFRLTGTRSNRDAIGATVRIEYGGVAQMRTVKTGSSYLSQSELPVTFGLGDRDVVDRVALTWPSGRTEDFTSIRAGYEYECVEGRGLTRGDAFRT